MTSILFIKQRIRRGPAIESSIEDWVEQAFRKLPGVELEVFNLGENMRLAEDRLRVAPPQQVQQARRAQTEGCLHHVRTGGHDNIFLLNGYLLNHFNPDFYPALRSCARKIVAWELDDPYYVDLALPFVDYLDVVFTVDSSTIPVYRRYEKTTEWLPLACDPEIHRPIADPGKKYQSDVCFIGVPFKGSRRVRLIDAIAGDLASLRARIIGATAHDHWKQGLGNYALIARHVLDTFVSTEEAIRYFNGARINLNLHKDSFGHMWDHNAHRLPAQSPCERTFSIAGCGAFQLIDSTRPDLARLFDLGREIVAFDDARDLSAKIRYYLRHDDEREEIARRTREIVCREHTYEQRARHIVETAFGQGGSG